MINIFSYLYEKMIDWSAHHRAPYFLAGISFAESSFFPIPPDVMLMSMGLAYPKRSWRYALIATLFSVLGGVFGYLLGYFGMTFIQPYLMASSYAPYVTRVMDWFEHQGVWVVILAGFSPFPYKLFTITAGMMQMAFWPFLVGSIIGRGLRFFLVSGILFFFGERIEPHLRRYVNRIGWSMVAIVVFVIFLTSCSERNGLAPVEEHRWRILHSNAKTVVVKRGDTLYSIAFRYDLDYRQMAAYNRLRSPYIVKIGQVLQLTPGRLPMRKANVSASSHYSAPRAVGHVIQPLAPRSTLGWSWPARGKVVAHFAPHNGIKGIKIAGKQGDKIYAALGGVVAYAGNGLTGYGNLIIIKHNEQFLTAYGHNLRNHVHEGQAVKTGQVIADMGMIERRYWGVHFEIRRLGQPVNPLGYIK
jgi:membrane protein YqaA with SNARE-associated domain